MDCLPTPLQNIVMEYAHESIGRELCDALDLLQQFRTIAWLRSLKIQIYYGDEYKTATIYVADRRVRRNQLFSTETYKKIDSIRYDGSTKVKFIIEINAPVPSMARILQSSWIRNSWSRTWGDMDFVNKYDERLKIVLNHNYKKGIVFNIR